MSPSALFSHHQTNLTMATVLPDRQVLCHLHCVHQVRQVAVVDITAQVAGEIHLHRDEGLHKGKNTLNYLFANTAPIQQNWYQYILKYV